MSNIKDEKMPAVGTECEVYIQQRDCWAKVKVLAVDGDYIVWRNGSDNKSYIGTHIDNIRSVNWNKEKVIAAAMVVADNSNPECDITFLNSLYEAGMLLLPTKENA